MHSFSARLSASLALVAAMVAWAGCSEDPSGKDEPGEVSVTDDAKAGDVAALDASKTDPDSASTKDVAFADDTKTPVDAGAVPDVDTGADVVSGGDAGVVASPDSAGVKDAVAQADAGSTTDAGTTTDAGSGSDVGASADTSSSPDGGAVAPKPAAGAFTKEPNDSKAKAVELPYGGGGGGSVGGADKADWFVVKAKHKGKLRVYRLGGHVAVKTTVAGDDHYIEVTASKKTGYQLLVDFRPDPVTLKDHDPFVVGKKAEIRGAGLGTSKDLVFVSIGHVQAEVTSASGSKIEVVVPYGASDGPLRVISGGRRAKVIDAKVTAPTYPAMKFSGGVLTKKGDTSWLAGVISVVAGRTVTAETLYKAVKPHGLTAAGWSPWRNRHRLKGAPKDIDAIGTLAKTLEKLPEIESAAAVTMGGSESGLWATAPYYAPSSPNLYDTQKLVGLTSAWKQFETMGGGARPPAHIGFFDTGLFSGITKPCNYGFNPYPKHTGAGGFELFLSTNGNDWTRPALADWTDRGDLTPSQCEVIGPGPQSNGHGTACVGIIGAVVPMATGATHTRANGALSGFSRPGIDTGLPFVIDVWSTRNEQRKYLTQHQMFDAIARAQGVKQVFGVNWGGPFGHQSPGDPFSWNTDSVWLVSAHNHNKLAHTYWPGKFAHRPNHLLVGATVAPNEGRWDPAGNYASNNGPFVNVVGPTYVYGLRGGTSFYGDIDGTSSVTPQVTAMAGFIRWLRSDLQAASVVALIRETGVDVNSYDSSWQRGAARLPRIDWMRLLTSEPMMMALYPEIRPLLLIGDRVGGANTVTAWPIHPETGTKNGLPKKIALGPCNDQTKPKAGPVDIRISPDGSRAAVTCNVLNKVVIISLQELRALGSVQLTGSIGLHDRAWMDPEGILHVPIAIDGGAGVALVDTYGPELIAEKKLNDDVVPWTIAGPQLRTIRGTLLSSKGKDAGQLTTYDHLARQRQFGVTYPPQKLSAHYKGAFPSGLALSPDGKRFTVTYSGTINDTELVDVPVGTAGFPVPVAKQNFSMKMLLTTLERPYDLAWLPDTGLSGAGMNGRNLFVTSFADDRLVMMKDVNSGTYPDTWKTVATFKNKSKSYPDRVRAFHNGRAMFVSEWKGSVRIIKLPLLLTGPSKAYTTAMGGFTRPVGIAPTPLISVVHPRHNVRVSRLLSPTYLLRDTSAVEVTCTVKNAIGGAVIATDTRNPLPDETRIKAGFATCGPFDLKGQAGGLLHIEIEVKSEHADGKKPTYRTIRVTRTMNGV